MELTIDKEFDAVCPELNPEELHTLEESILRDGCRDAIVLWANHDDTILDGHNRYKICRKHEIKFKTVSLRMETRADAMAWMIRNQNGRRNLNESQRAILAARLATLGDGQKKSGAQQCAPSQSEAAEEFGVSRRTVQSAKVVVDKGTAALTKAVNDGEIPVAHAAAVATLPKAEQRKIVAKGPEAVKAAAKEVKADKAAEQLAKKQERIAAANEAPKISGGTSFDPEEIEAVNAHSATLAGKQAPYDKMLEHLRQLSLTWNQLTADELDGVYVVHKKQRVATLIKEMRGAIAQARPESWCSKCSGKRCSKCSNCGWWPKSVVEGMTK